VDFEFGETVQSNAFLDRNPKVLPAFERLAALTNKCLVRNSQTQNRTEDICFDLGHTCRQDFLEILFLAANGYGIAASKILRGLYERAVTLAYIVNHPEKAERFFRFAAIQEHKAVNAARAVVSQEEFDKVITPEMAEQIRKSYEEIKPEFQVTRCHECGDKGTAFSWDIDFASMVRDVGERFQKFYLGAYVIPNLHVHATFASSQPKRPTEKEIAEINRRDGEFALLNATSIVLLALRAEDTLFALNLNDDIEACEHDVSDVWWKPPDV
jgi:hypothetical protein